MYSTRFRTGEQPAPGEKQLMSHVIIIIDDNLDAMKGDASTGSLANLRDAADAVDYKLVHNQLPPLQRDSAHEVLENLQAWLESGGESSVGAAETADNFITDLNVYL